MVRIATWNLENLFLPGDACRSARRPAAYDAKLDGLAAVIADLRPTCWRSRRWATPQRSPTSPAGSTATGRRRWPTRTAAASGWGSCPGPDLTGVEQVRDFPDGIGPVQVDDDRTTINALGRPALRARRADRRSYARPALGAPEVQAAHLPRRPVQPRDEGERARYAVYALHRRAAEAAGVREYATALLEEGSGRGRVAGDLNDEPQAATTQILLGPPGSEIGTGGFDQPDAGDALRLWNTAGFIDPEQRWSRVYRGRGELIDHVLCSQRLVHAVERATTWPVEVSSIDDHPVQRRNEPASDHRPVVVDLADA